MCIKLSMHDFGSKQLLMGCSMAEINGVTVMLVKFENISKCNYNFTQCNIKIAENAATFIIKIKDGHAGFPGLDGTLHFDGDGSSHFEAVDSTVAGKNEEK